MERFVTCVWPEPQIYGPRKSPRREDTTPAAMRLVRSARASFAGCLACCCRGTALETRLPHQHRSSASSAGGQPPRLEERQRYGFLHDHVGGRAGGVQLHDGFPQGRGAVRRVVPGVRCVGRRAAQEVPRDRLTRASREVLGKGGGVQFSLTEDNNMWSAGTLWQGTGAMPMGGSCSAGLHSVWGLFHKVSLLKQCGALIQREPIPLWTSTRCNAVRLSQFRDNVNVAARAPTTASEMAAICAECWG